MGSFQLKLIRRLVIFHLLTQGKTCAYHMYIMLFSPCLIYKYGIYITVF